MIRAGLLALGLMLAAAMPAAAQPVRILVDGAWEPRHAPFFLARDRGRFAAAGIEPTIEPGRGAGTVAVMVGQRAFDIGHMPASSAASAMARGVPIRMIAVYEQQAATALVGITGKVRLLIPQIGRAHV